MYVQTVVKGLNFQRALLQILRFFDQLDSICFILQHSSCFSFSKNDVTQKLIRRPNQDWKNYSN